MTGGRAPVFPSMLSWVVLGAIVVATVVAYRGVTANGFVLDDVHTVARNPAIRSLSNVGTWFSSPYAVGRSVESGNYRPVLVASYALDYAVWGGGPAGFHATNLFLHVIVVVLVFSLARRLWGRWGAAAGAAAWMALHPVNAEAVNYLAARSSVLMTLFVLGAVLAYDRYARADGEQTGIGSRRIGRGWLGGALVLGALGLGTKEAAAVLPALILVWDRARFGERDAWRAGIARTLPFGGVVAAWLVVRAVVMAEVPPAAPAGSAGQAALFAAKIVATSIGHSIWPAAPAIDMGWPVTIDAAEGAFAVLGVLGLVAMTWALFRVDPRLGWGLTWFGITLVPLLALPFVTRLTLYQDHRVYLGAVGVAWIVGRLVDRAAQALRPRRAIGVPFVLGLFGLATAAAVADATRTALWGDNERLWEATLAAHPTSALARNERGLRLLNADRLVEAEAEFQEALRLIPQYGYTRVYLGMVSAARGDPERAIAEFTAALRLRPRFTEARVRLAMAREQQGRFDEALAEYDRVLRDEPTAATALVRSAVIFEHRGQWDEAVARYRRALAVDADRDETRIALGAALLRKEQWAEARDLFATFLVRHPDSYAARFYIGLTYARQGQDDRALAEWRDAVRLNPEDPDLLVELGLLFARRGKWSDAVRWFDQAVSLDPGRVSVHLNLASVAERLGDVRRARSHYRAVLDAAPGAADDLLRAQAREALRRLAAPAPEARTGGERR